MQDLINKLCVPKVLLRYIMMNFTNIDTIKNLILNVLDIHSKNILEKAQKGFDWNCKHGHLTAAKWSCHNGPCYC